MAAAVSSVPRLTFFANDGTPLNGGLVYTYLAGTLTPKTFYSDESKTVPVSNPIVINSAGRPQASAVDTTEVNLYYSGSAKFVVKDSSGSTLYTADNVEEVAVAGSTIAFPVTVTGGVSGAIPYFSGTTTLSVSALLSTNSLALGGGAGQPPFTDSNWTIEQTAHTLSSATQPRAVAFNSAVQSVADSTLTVLTLDSEDVDVGGMHSTSANTSRLTVPAGAAGFYYVFGQSSFAANATGVRGLELFKNGATALAFSQQISTGAGPIAAFSVLWAGALIATDYVELRAYQNSGGALNIGNATREYASALTAVKLW